MPKEARGPARIFHESSAATADMAALPGVLGCRTLRRTVQVRLRFNSLRFPGGTAIFTVSRQQFVKYPGVCPDKLSVSRVGKGQPANPMAWEQ